MYAVLDVETTGHDDGDVIQIALLNPFGTSFTSNVKPNKRVLPAATAIHGVTNEEAAGYPPWEDVSKQLREYVTSVLPPGVIIIGHNVSYDAEAINRCFRLAPQRLLCTLRMARRLISMDEIGGHRLDAVYYYLYPEKLAEMLAARANHDALRDCKLTLEVYEALVKRAIAAGELREGSNPLDIMNWVASPMIIKAWPFGKYRGEPLDADWSYAEWYVRQKDPDPDIIHSLQKLKASRPGARYTR